MLKHLAAALIITSVRAIRNQPHLLFSAPPFFSTTLAKSLSGEKDRCYSPLGLQKRISWKGCIVLLQQSLLGFSCDACVYSVAGQEGARQGRWHPWQVKPIREGGALKAAAVGEQAFGWRLAGRGSWRGSDPVGLLGAGFLQKPGLLPSGWLCPVKSVRKLFPCLPASPEGQAWSAA